MKCLTIQLQPSLKSNHTESEVISKVKTLGRYPEVDIIEEDQYLVNLNFFSDDVVALWRDLKEGLLDTQPLGEWVKSVAIIACEGEQGWDDCLILHHFDPSETLDTL